MGRLGYVLASALAVAFTAATELHAAPLGQTRAEIDTYIAESAARYGVSAAWLHRIVRCESTYNPRAVGRLGERGLVQILPGGSMDQLFRARGYNDPFEAAEAVDFLAWALSRGHAGAWSCA